MALLSAGAPNSALPWPLSPWQEAHCSAKIAFPFSAAAVSAFWPLSCRTYSATSLICGRFQHLILEEGGHGGVAGFFAFAVANAVGDGVVDGVDGAAPQPFVVVQVRETGEPLRTGTMALRTVDVERRAPAGQGEVQQFRIGADIAERRRLELVEMHLLARLGAVDFLDHFGARAVAEHALGVGADQGPSRIGNPVPEGPDDAGIENPAPPVG